MKKTFEQPLYIALLVAIVLVAGAWLGGASMESGMTTGSGYDLTQMQADFETALLNDPSDEQSLYTLARIYYISGQYDRSLAAIAAYEELYPDNERIHYVAGLAHTYAGDLDAAKEAFTAFIDSGLATWPGYLDLASVYFQQGEFDEAESVLVDAVNMFGENAWLNTSRGAVALAQGENEDARIFLSQARTQAQDITLAQWRENYSLNDPSKFESEIAQMKAVIEANLALANDSTTPAKVLAHALHAPFAHVSPAGVSTGFTVSACGDSCINTNCISAANICGQVSTGTQDSCGGNVCSATVPPNPAGTCTVATPCGNAEGFVGCNGGCNITRYPVCLSTTNPGGTGEVTWIVLGDGPDGSGIGVTDIAAEITVFPALVNPGGQTVVRWVSTETVECTVTGENGDQWTGPVAGEQISGPITQETDYLLSCEGYDGSTVTDVATVRIVPVWQEF